MTCASCGARLPPDSWSLRVCSADCLDAFATSLGPAPAWAVPAGALA